MIPLKRRRVFGPLTYGALGLASLIFLGFHAYRLWPVWQQHRDLRSLAGQLADPDPLVRRQAADALVKASAIPSLIAGVRDEDARVRRLCTEALGRFPAEPDKVRGALTVALGDADLEVHFLAARALKRVGGRRNVRAVETLVALIADPDPDHFPDRTLAAEVLRDMGSGSETQVIDGLIPLVASKAVPLRRSAIECLALLAPRARAAVPAMEHALSDADPVTICLAGLALSEIEGWEKERARWVLKAVTTNERLPSRIRSRARWIFESNLVAGSEISQPVHTLREVADELRRLEVPAKPEVLTPVVDETLPVAPR